MDMKKVVAAVAVLGVLAIGGYFIFANGSVNSGDLQGKFTYSQKMLKTLPKNNDSSLKKVGFKSSTDKVEKQVVDLQVPAKDADTGSSSSTFNDVESSESEQAPVSYECRWGDSWEPIFFVNSRTTYFDEENRGYDILLDAVNNGCDLKVVAITNRDNYNTNFECTVANAGTSTRGQRTFGCDSAARVSGQTTDPDTGEDIQGHMVNTTFDFVWEADGRVWTRYAEWVFKGNAEGFRSERSAKSYTVFARK